MAGNRIKPVYIPLNERTHIVGYAEMMGYLGGISREKLIRDYINKGLVPQLYANTFRWKRAVVDKWLDEHDEYQKCCVNDDLKKNILQQ